MALGCAFIFLVVLMWWRRRAKKKREKRTAVIATTKNLHGKGWRERLVRFGEKFFGHSARGRAGVLPVHRDLDGEDIKLRNAEDARHAREVESFIDAYDYSHKSESRSGTLRSKNGTGNPNRLSGHSLYSEVTGKPRQAAEPRQPVKKDIASRFSSSTLSSSYSYRTRDRDRVVLAPTPVPTEAEEYVMAVRPTLNPSPIQPNNTGNTRNPFRQA